MKKFLFVSVSILLFNVALLAQPGLGDISPDIALPNTNGTITKLSSLKGKVVLIDFWASWCGPCRVSNRSIQSLYQKYNDKGFEIFGVSLDESKAAWQNAIKQDKTKWIQVVDTKAFNGNQLMRTWNLSYIPFTCLLDKRGVVVAINPQKKDLEKLLPTLL